MAYQGRVQWGDTVRWRDAFTQRYLEGVVVRCARDGAWADVRYPHVGAVLEDLTYLTQRVRVTKLHIVRKAGES